MAELVARVSAPAKLNLCLRVGPVRADGFHPVASLMVALEGLADTVTVRPAATRSVVCAGVAERQNLAWHALEALETHVGRALPCAVSIEKRIPAEAGLGGGSSDAAATLLAANMVHDLALDDATLTSVAAGVGSDVPFFVRGGAQWAGGRGEVLAPVPNSPPFAAVIVKPAVGLSTARVYRAFDERPPPPLAPAGPPPATFAELVGWVGNDLTDAATACHPPLADTFRMLTTAGAHATLLCGSGTAVAGLFPSREQAAAAATKCADLVAVVTPAPPRPRDPFE